MSCREEGTKGALSVDRCVVCGTDSCLTISCLILQEFLGRGPLDVSDSKGSHKIKQCVLFLVSPST